MLSARFGIGMKARDAKREIRSRGGQGEKRKNEKAEAEDGYVWY